MFNYLILSILTQFFNAVSTKIDTKIGLASVENRKGFRRYSTYLLEIWFTIKL